MYRGEERMSKFPWICALLLAMAASGAQASVASADKKSGQPVFDVATSFAEQSAAIRDDLAKGEKYSEISRQDRDLVSSALDRISSSLDKVGSVNELSDAEKAKVFNDQEVINTILTRAGDDSRLVCTREKKVGSHRTTTQCLTVAERRRKAEESQKALRDNQRVMGPPPG